MIIEMLLNSLLNLLSDLLMFTIPSLPPEVHSYIDTMIDYLVTGATVLSNYVPLSYLMTLFGVILAIDVAINIYHFVMWILRKIPMIGID